ncbi:hypothetical protein M446_3985 [Methylobacterium sp. 4-46]|uniref:hypothetical protein n=1 Tax=unclassified Methylobacterium TaxID=2615210 RepID=UPI000165C6BE|nr:MULTISPECIES: hypothetical protein [Methylobacterium]ACA18350.1 hypothetical protein M446_3985 [Methylobacterium sp. 4-46]WFT77647.1 hypothetical protein QA634_20250 [Methylobacterium nodulans]
MIFFTVCSANFMGYALTLRETILAHEKDATFYLLLCDREDSVDAGMYDFEIIYIDQLGVPNLENMKQNYNITELNTSLKPFMFLYLFDRHPGSRVVYLDPDIMVLSPLDELRSCLDEGAACVLTPHITEPAEFADMNDGMFLLYGIYNLGFCCFADTPQVRRVVSWWSRRLESDCSIDLPRGRFVDQKWADLLPAMIDNTFILRHVGYNVAYWNLSQRRLSRTDGTWSVNGFPLRFFHFSGNIIEDEAVFSRHSHEFNIHSFGVIGELLTQYRSLIYKNGHRYYSSLQYGFNWSGASGRNEHTLLEIFENRPKHAASPHLHLTPRGDRPNLPDAVRTVRASAEARLAEAARAAALTGHCIRCGGRTDFVLEQEAVAGSPGTRTRVVCTGCELDAARRVGIHVGRQLLRSDGAEITYPSGTGDAVVATMRATEPGCGLGGAASLCVVSVPRDAPSAVDVTALCAQYDRVVAVHTDESFESAARSRGAQVSVRDAWSETCLYVFEPTSVAILERSEADPRPPAAGESAA